MEFKVVIADDGVDLLMDHERFDRKLKGAIDRLCQSGVTVTFESLNSRLAALERLQNQEDRVDLVFVDILWPTLASGSEDSAKDLLIAALDRSDAVVVVFSLDAQKLMKYLFDESKSAYRPHAALFKGQIDLADVLQGTLVTGFSNAQKPLRSIGRSFEYLSSDEQSIRIIQSIGEDVIAEFACMIIPRLVSARVSMLTGGLSGAGVVLVEAVRSDVNREIPQTIILKLARDKRILHDELHAHREYVRSFPTGQFAYVIREEIASFGGWHALAFGAASGKTARELGEAVLVKRRWRNLFSRDLLASYVRNSEVFTITESEWVAGDDGLLAGNRWPRLVQSAKRLKAGSAELAKLRRGTAAMFRTDRRQTATSLVHGDFHTRNVLLSEDGRCTWIDAASIRQSGVWCEDLCRFAVFLACGLADPKDGESVIAQQLQAALCITSVSGSNWQKKLQACIAETLDTFRREWRGKGTDIDIAADWDFVMRAELLRAAYTFDMFDGAVRLGALKSALD
jgi:Phosphotransferase enzyme family